MQELLKEFEGKNVEILVDENGEIWFVAKLICDILEIKNSRDAVSKLDEDEKLMSAIATSGQNRNVNLVNESGLYSLIFLSRKPIAKKFKKWVTAEVLPSLRKHGTYTIKDVSKLIQEENTSLENRISDLDADINALYIVLCRDENFRQYNSKLSEKKALVERINSNNKALKINSTHLQNFIEY